MPNLGPINKPLRFLRRQLPPLNFITIHYTYFFATCLLSAVIFWGASTPPRSVSFVDSLFLCVSAMTLAGLNTVNLSTVNTFQQILLFLLIMMGSAILVSAVVVQIRKRAFEKRLTAFEVQRREEKKRSRSVSRGRSWSKRTLVDRGDVSRDTLEEDDKGRPNSPDFVVEKRSEQHAVSFEQRSEADQVEANTDSELDATPSVASLAHRLTFRGDTRFEVSHPPRRRRTSLLSMQGVGARPDSSLQSISPARNLRPVSREAHQPTPSPPSHSGDIARHFEALGGWVSRNSQFHGLSDKEREKLGGYEYRAVSLLAWLVPVYFLTFQMLGCLGCAAWVAINRADTARRNGLNAWWVGAFNAVSAFNNSGMSLLDANMTAFQTGYYLLLTMGLLILAGNTCYPIFLRLIVWSMWKTVGMLKGEEWQERGRTLRFLLDHPRRCYTNLFPSQHTWWLLLVVIILNSTDWAAFEILNINNEQLDSVLPTSVRVIDGLFQAFAVRSGGFYVVSIPTLRISLQVLYVVMMYISVYPVVITMRNSNVYEERSLGIYAEDQEAEVASMAVTAPDSTSLVSGKAHGLFQRIRNIRHHLTSSSHFAHAHSSNSHFVRQQLRAQLAHDAWTIVLALFLILIIESTQFQDNPVVFSAFNFLFEIVSAYGCVGISIGLPWAAYSFCGSWHALSKLILCAVMLRGRHRGLPVAIDKAVLLPGEETALAEEDDGRIRLARTVSRGSRVEV